MTNTDPVIENTSQPALAIRTQALRKTFGSFIAVDDVDIEVRTGEVFALLGPNGAGKSTFIRMLTTLTAVTSGYAEVFGYDVERMPDAVRAVIGVVPQAMTSDPDLSAQENLNFYAGLYGMSRSRCRELSEELLQAVDLMKWRDKAVGTFSGGMRRRLEIARSMIHQPRVLFLDEPTTGLDPASRIAMWEMLRQLKSRTNLTIFLTTHYMEEAENLCDRVAIFDHGHLVALGTPVQLQANIAEMPPIEALFDFTPPNWHDLLLSLPGVVSAEEKNGLWQLVSNDRMESSSALLGMAKKNGVAVLSLAVRGHTLEDVFIQYTGSDLRDATGKQRRDVSHFYERPQRH